MGPLDEDRECPDERDLQRFGHDTRNCPSCGEEVYDEASMCHACGTTLETDPSGKPPPLWAMMTAGVLILVIAVFILF